MKLKLFLIALSIISSSVALAWDVNVRGYTRRDGTYVQPHQRTNPDLNPYNNYSSPKYYSPHGDSKIRNYDHPYYYESYDY